MVQAVQGDDLLPQRVQNDRTREMEGHGMSLKKDKSDHVMQREKPSYHEGANDERTAILAKVRRMNQHVDTSQQWILRELEQWLLKRNERYRKNPGGL